MKNMNISSDITESIISRERLGFDSPGDIEFFLISGEIVNREFFKWLYRDNLMLVRALEDTLIKEAFNKNIRCIVAYKTVNSSRYLIGFVLLALDVNNTYDKTANIVMINVLEEFKRVNIGSNLIHLAEYLAKVTYKKDCMYLNTYIDFEGIEDFYTRLGYIKIQENKETYEATFKKLLTE